MPSPDELEQRFTLRTAVARYDTLRTRESLASTVGDSDAAADPDAPTLSREEALELLTLGEVIARKAAYGRQLSVRTARQAGASWSQIGAALGASKQAAWEAHGRWIDAQSARPTRTGHLGWSDDEMTAARTLAGPPEGDAAE